MLTHTHFTIVFEKENDGRWIAEVQELPGALCYGKNRKEAQAKAKALALRVTAERLESGKLIPGLAFVEFNLTA